MKTYTPVVLCLLNRIDPCTWYKLEIWSIYTTKFIRWKLRSSILPSSWAQSVFLGIPSLADWNKLQYMKYCSFTDSIRWLHKDQLTTIKYNFTKKEKKKIEVNGHKGRWEGTREKSSRSTLMVTVGSLLSHSSQATIYPRVLVRWWEVMNEHGTARTVLDTFPDKCHKWEQAWNNWQHRYPWLSGLSYWWPWCPSVITWTYSQLLISALPIFKLISSPVKSNINDYAKANFTSIHRHPWVS